MNKAAARHYLKQAGWNDASIAMAERILRHDASRRAPAVVATLRGYAARQQAPSEQMAWAEIVGWIEADDRQVEALIALLAL